MRKVHSETRCVNYALLLIFLVRHRVRKKEAIHKVRRSNCLHNRMEERSRLLEHGQDSLRRLIDDDTESAWKLQKNMIYLCFNFYSKKIFFGHVFFLASFKTYRWKYLFSWSDSKLHLILIINKKLFLVIKNLSIELEWTCILLIMLNLIFTSHFKGFGYGC